MNVLMEGDGEINDGRADWYMRKVGVDIGQKACATPKAWYAPLGVLQCVGQPQGACEGGPWGAEENVRAWP